MNVHKISPILLQILIQGREALNRAVNGDTVAIELLPKSEWSAPSEIVLEEGAEEDDIADDAVVDGKTAKELAMLKSNVGKDAERQPTAKIVGIIRRKWRQYCGILKPNLVESATRHIFVPADRRIPRIRIETRQADKLQGQRIIVAIDSWPRSSRYPQGHFVRSLGPLGNMAT